MYRDYSKFFTLRPTADYMVSLLNPQEGDDILEPHAGDGALVRSLIRYRISNSLNFKIYAVELNPDHEIDLEYLVNDLYIGDFIKFAHNTHYSANKIIANPPFGNGIDLDAHFKAMLKVLKIGGTLVALVPNDYSLKLNFSFSVSEYPLENWGTNKDGTITPIKIIKYEKRRV